MPTPLFRLDLTRHLDRALQLTAARPNRVQLVTWAIPYLAHDTDVLGVVVIDKHHPARVEQADPEEKPQTLSALARHAMGSRRTWVTAMTTSRFPSTRKNTA